MRLSIYSLKKVLFEGDALSVNCKSTSGEITILDHHIPLISALAPGVITIIDKNKQEQYVNAGSGFLEVSSGNRLKLLVDEA